MVTATLLQWVDMKHIDVPLGKRHQPHNWEFADEAERLAETITNAVLIGSTSLQKDDDSLWLLKSVGPVVWVELTTRIRQKSFTSSSQWQVLHNLGRPVTVSVKDQYGNVVIAEVQHTSLNEFFVRFGSAQSGSVTYF